MPYTCCAYNCRSRFKRGVAITFHRFPFRNEEIFQEWLVNVRRLNWMPTKHSRLCSLHFTPDCFRVVNDRHYLWEKAVPTIFSFPKDCNVDCSTVKKSLRKTESPPSTLPVDHKLVNSSQIILPVMWKTFKIPTVQVSSSLVEKDHSYSIQSPRKLLSELNALREKLILTKRTLKTMKQKDRRNVERIRSLQKTVNRLRAALPKERASLINNSFGNSMPNVC